MKPDTPTPAHYDGTRYAAGEDERPAPALGRLAEEYEALRRRDLLSRTPGLNPRSWESAEPLTVEDRLRMVAMSEAIARRALEFHGSEVHRAVEAGASWPEVAAALGVKVADAREMYGSWIKGQHHLYQTSKLAELGWRVGLNDAEHADATARLRGQEVER